MNIEKLAKVLTATKNNSIFTYEANVVPNLQYYSGMNDKDIIYYLYMTLDDFGMDNKALKGDVEILEHDINSLTHTNKALNDANKDLKDKNLQLVIKMNKLQKDLEIHKKALHSFKGHDVQRELLHHGQKIADKKDIDIAKVKELLDQGFTKVKIAETLGVSRGLVYRRIKSLKEIENQLN